MCISDKSRLQQYLTEGYTQKTGKLDVFLLPHWEQLHVSEIFTPSILVDDQNEKMETFERQGSLREMHSNKLAGDQRLRSYKKLLYNGNELEKRVFLVGEAGAGKTTFCKHLTDMWCQTNHTNEERRPAFLQQLEDVTVLKQFRYLFYISCRFAEEKETILDMINNQLFNDNKMKEVAINVLKHNPEDCFIIVDGADEWKGSPSSETGRREDIAGLPGMAGVENCVILITSRPWRFQALSKKTQKTFRCLKLKGIADVKMLVESILRKMEYPKPVRSSINFLKQVNVNDMSELMESPLLLIIVLGCWIDDKFLHEIMCINYIKMIQSFIHRLKGHSGWSSSESRLLHFPNLHDLETKWEQQSNELPPLLSTYTFLQRYAGLFLPLGHLGFDLLLGKKEQSLIFSKAVLTKYLRADNENDESVNVCLALGILSKAETTMRGIEKLESYAFCHKTFQEFFAALWLASKYTNEKSKLYKCIRNVTDLYDYEIMITFLCTFDPNTGKKFWLEIAEVIETYKALEIENTLEVKMHWPKMELQNLVCKQIEKQRFDLKDNTPNQVCYYIPYIMIRGVISHEEIMLLCRVMEEYSCNVKGVYVDLFEPGQQALSILRLTSSCCGLKHLNFKYHGTPVEERQSDSLEHLLCVRGHTHISCYRGIDLQKQNKLENLNIIRFPVKNLLLPVKGARLTSINLSEIKMDHHNLIQLSGSLSSYSVLERLTLKELRCSEHGRYMCCIPVLDLKKHNKLEELKLSTLSVEGLKLPMEGARITSLSLSSDNVTMNHHGFQQLSKILSFLSDIKDLFLNGVACSKHRYMCCLSVLDLRRHKKLEKLVLEDLYVGGLMLPMEGVGFRSLHLDNIAIKTHHGLEQLSRSLSSMSDVECLKLNKLTCSEHEYRRCILVLDLQKHKQLEILDLKDLSVEGLLLPMEEAGIRSLSLYDITMTHHGLEQLSRSLSFLSDTEDLSLDIVRCRKHKYKCWIPALDLQKHNTLEILCLKDLSVEGLLLPMEEVGIRSLSLDHVTMTHHGLEQLSRSLSFLSDTEDLSLDSVSCSEHNDGRCCLPVLDLQKQNMLNTMSLKYSSVEGLLLGGKVRSLSLYRTMTHHGIEQLSRSLSYLSDTNNLSIDNVRCSEHKDLCCGPVLDLQKKNNLKTLCLQYLFVEGLLLPSEGARIRSLSLDHVTMIHHGLEQLSRYLSSLTDTEKMSLDNVRCSEHKYKCCIPVLDLQKQNMLNTLSLQDLAVEGMLLPREGARIRSLSLDNVTMTHHGLEQLSRYLSSLTDTEKMSLKHVHCSEHKYKCCIPVLDLQKQNMLNTLSLQDLAVEGLLLPSEGARIRSLSLDHVTMTHHGLEQLSRYLSSLTDTEKMSLDDVRCSEHNYKCCIPVLDLQKQNMLNTLSLQDLAVEGMLLPREGASIRSLSLDNVIMTHHGLEQLSRYLSSLTDTKKMSLKHVCCSEYIYKCCIPVLDLQKQNMLNTLSLQDLAVEGLLLPSEGARIRFLSLDNVIMTHHGLEQLSRYLSSLTDTKKMSLKHVRCSEHIYKCCIPVLDLQKHTKQCKIKVVPDSPALAQKVTFFWYVKK